MSEDDQINNDEFSNSFLIKDTSGQLKKVQDDQVVDFQVQKPVAKPAPVAPAAPKSPVTPQPMPSPAKPATAKQPVAVPVSFAPQSPISASPKAAFYIDPEDELEIKQHAESLKKLMGGAPAPVVAAQASLDGVAQKILSQHNVHFADDILNKRAEKIIESFFHEARSAIEMQEVMTRPQKIGGLALSSEQAEKMMGTIRQEATTLRQSGVIGKKPAQGSQPSASAPKVASMMAPPPPAFIPRPAPVRSVTPPPPPLPVSPKPTAAAETAKLAAEVMAEIAKVEKKPAQPAPPVQVIPKSAPIPTPVAPKPTPAPVAAADSMAHIAYARQPEPYRPHMVDIRQPMKVLGPVEELAEIDPKEFRRLSPNPAEASSKIMEKINLLQEESWQIRMDAVKAWQRSATNQLYVAIGRESLESGLRLEAVLNAREKAGKPTLSMDEFAAINSLNSNFLS